MKKTTFGAGILFFSFLLTNNALANFSDVPISHPNYGAINYVQTQGIVEGYPDGTYGADLKINRAEFTKIIVGANYKPEQIDGVQQCFLKYEEDDAKYCKDGDAECKKINLAMYAGCVGQNFAPNTDLDALTKRANDYEQCLKDIPHDQWFSKYICFAKMEKMIDGYPDGTFQPGNQIKLVEAAKIILNGFKYSVPTDSIWYKPYILKLEELKALPNTLTGFGHLITRGEMAEMIDRLMEKITIRPSTTYENLEGKIISTNIFSYANAFFSIDREAKDFYKAYIVFHDKNVLSGNFNEIEEMRKDAIDFFETSKSKALALGGYQGDSNLINALVINLNAKIKVFNEEEVELIKLEKEFDEVKENISLSEQNEYVEKINVNTDVMIGKIFTANQNLRRIYDAFCLKYKNYSTPSHYVVFAIDLYEETLYEYGVYSKIMNQISTSEDLNSINDLRKQSLLNIENIKKGFTSSEAYNADDPLRDGILKGIDLSIDLLKNEENQLLQLWMKVKQNGTSSEADLAEEKKLVTAINQKLELRGQTFEKAKNDFATKYNIEIE